MKGELKIDWATHKAALYACKNWHYSHSVPNGKLVKVGVWEKGKFIGVVIFGRGANNNIGKPYSLAQTEVCELVRIALTKHENSVSRIMRIAMKFLKMNSPTLKLIVSYADPEQGHHGGVYQAGGWIYKGRSQAQKEVIYKGKIMHKRTANSLFGTNKGMEKSKMFWKHIYLMPLDKNTRAVILPLAKPYPKRVVSIGGNASDIQSEDGGSTPTTALHFESKEGEQNGKD